MTIVETPCARCGQVLKLTKTNSLNRADGTPYAVYCSDCYEYLKNSNNWTRTHDTHKP